MIKINTDDVIIREIEVKTEDDIYKDEVLEDKVEDDEMSAEDAAFMQGYNQAS